MVVYFEKLFWNVATQHCFFKWIWLYSSWGGCVQCDRTRVSGVNPEALVPKAAQQDESIVSRDDKTLRADLNALIQQVWDLTPVAAYVSGCRREKESIFFLKKKTERSKNIGRNSKSVIQRFMYIDYLQRTDTPMRLDFSFDWEDLWENT